MKKEWKIRYYKNDEGECPIKDFMKTLSENDKDKINAWIQHLKREGINIRRPQGDYLRDGIHELRVKLTRGQTRTLYFFCYEDYIILTHTIYKRTDEVSASEINRAMIYKEKFLQKYNKENIKDL